MDNAMIHIIDALAGHGPIYLFVTGVLCILVFLVIKLTPFWQEIKNRQLDIETEREQRKAEEARMRDERDRENAAIAARQIDAQERSTAAINGITAQMAVITGQLETSQHGSQHMGETVETMAAQVHEIHGAVVKR